MTTSAKELLAVEDPQREDIGSGFSRRRFLGGLGGVAAAVAGGVAGVPALEPQASAQELGELTEAVGAVPSSGRLRRKHAWQLRKEAADFWMGRPVLSHLTNGDETRYPNHIGNYSKSLPHNSFGEVD